ncbi:hypothetical protein M2311_003641 [Rhizobium leguminosarum]|nr:hypothetical protein [Rhizobium leguminosarum]
MRSASTKCVYMLLAGIAGIACDMNYSIADDFFTDSWHKMEDATHSVGDGAKHLGGEVIKEGIKVFHPDPPDCRNKENLQPGCPGYKPNRHQNLARDVRARGNLRCNGPGDKRYSAGSRACFTDNEEYFCTGVSDNSGDPNNAMWESTGGKCK